MNRKRLKRISDAALPMLRVWFVRHVYARHNRSPAVRQALSDVFSRLAASGGWGVDVGSGGRRLHPRLFSLDIAPRCGLDCLGQAETLPFRGGSLHVVVSQEVCEHLADPWQALAESARVLKPGGRLYLQTPFVIGYHPGPADYWRFSREGLRELVESAGLELERLEVSVGAGTGLYRIAVEFCAVTASALSPRFYLPVKALAALLFRPLCLADVLTPANAARDRIRGGYLAIASKPSCAS